MNSRERFTFTLKAETPVHFGGDSPGALLLDGDDKPFVSGNSIGGALRNWLNTRSTVSPVTVLHYLGGPDDREEFIESQVYISDGYLYMPQGPFIMEGTAVDPKTGSARNNHKYKRYDLPKGTKLVFTVECDTEVTLTAEAPERLSFEQLIYTCAAAIDRGELRFGGQKSNGHGCFALQHLTCQKFSFDSFVALDQFVFNRHSQKSNEEDRTESAKKYKQYISDHPATVLSLKGHFPYGVYQSYIDRSRDDKQASQVTGLQRSTDGKYYLPGSSIKGLLRHEMRRLLFRMLQDQQELAELEARVETIVQEWFGSQEKMGSVVVTDVVIDKAREMKSKRIEDSDSNPVYNRIDRITGGVIDGALKSQNEVRGDAEIRLELRAGADDEGKLFPLIYLLRRIGSGLVPLGGRTVIGLGEFEAKETEVSYNGEMIRISNLDPLDDKSQSKLQGYYDRFMTLLDSEGGA
ncbi:RAMP superfamily CRISPR-associated protein [Paenibacillus senegalimassiliensis]|uniref:RAMP superfamily CRISPR-associated protein n=1 Tax=Paenibacillus senegalimassiliensis TaxID=1737426 RepID=UPI00073E3BA1|nr:RAMP superfamily CRISPR-associated protein [Paenibacillus senegalimassiliensis]